MNFKLTLFLALLVVALVVGACAGTDGGGEAPTAPTLDAGGGEVIEPTAEAPPVDEPTSEAPTVEAPQ
jgi:hypothetical protein